MPLCEDCAGTLACLVLICFLVYCTSGAFLDWIRVFRAPTFSAFSHIVIVRRQDAHQVPYSFDLFCDGSKSRLVLFRCEKDSGFCRLLPLLDFDVGWKVKHLFCAYYHNDEQAVGFLVNFVGTWYCTASLIPLALNCVTQISAVIHPGQLEGSEISLITLASESRWTWIEHALSNCR